MGSLPLGENSKQIRIHSHWDTPQKSNSQRRSHVGCHTVCPPPRQLSSEKQAAVLKEEEESGLRRLISLPGIWGGGQGLLGGGVQQDPSS